MPKGRHLTTASTGRAPSASLICVGLSAPVMPSVRPLLLIEGKMMTLRIMTVIRYGLLLLSATFAQSEERDADAYSIRLVKEAVKNPGFALGLSFTEKEINRLGDRVSIALLKIYDVDGLRSPHNIKNYLRIVRAAFVAPRIVQIVEDRKPQVTMFVHLLPLFPNMSAQTW